MGQQMDDQGTAGHSINHPLIRHCLVYRRFIQTTARLLYSRQRNRVQQYRSHANTAVRCQDLQRPSGGDGTCLVFSGSSVLHERNDDVLWWSGGRSVRLITAPFGGEGFDSESGDHGFINRRHFPSHLNGATGPVNIIPTTLIQSESELRGLRHFQLARSRLRQRSVTFQSR